MEQTERFQALPNGVKQDVYKSGNVEVTRVCISTNQAAQQLGKPEGTYITIEVPPFYASVENADEQTQAIADELAKMLPRQGLVLIVGLGNKHITPDAIGPLTIDGILATRHISPEIAKASGLENIRSVAALAPGVLGQTGIETAEIIHSITNSIKPAAVIVIDALASRSVDRLGCTVQLADSGISPGSGVQNKRKELSKNTLGVPVISMGIPTVVDALTLSADVLASGGADADSIERLLPKNGEQMMVTPREIDLLVDRAAKTLSLAINKALQPQLSQEDIVYLVS
ncbi:MAG TPA: GPR endopeptidase [Ruminococcaceae bacterium]|nr:GPR endopeptidase [Oscillospiraceae bacterium]